MYDIKYNVTCKWNNGKQKKQSLILTLFTAYWV